MFPIPWNKEYRKKDGTLVKISDAMSGGGGGSDLPPHSSTDAGKVLTVGEDGNLEWDTRGSGGGDASVIMDFTKYGNRTINGVQYSGSGATFSSLTSRIALPRFVNDITLYIDIDTLSLTSGSNKRFIMASYNQGLVYRESGLWGFYGSATGEADAWEMSEISDGSFFNDSTVKVYIDSTNHWHFYKDGVLIFEPTIRQAISDFNIGSADGYSIQGGIVTGLRIYNGNYTE